MSAKPELFVPEAQAYLLTGHDQNVQELWSEQSFDYVVRNMPDAQYQELADGSQQGFVELRSQFEDDPTEAVAVMLPFANGYSPSMHIRAAVMQDMAGYRRTLVFPNNTRSQTWYDLSKGEDAAQALAQNVLETAARQGIEKLHIVGYSQGATIGALMLKDIAKDFDVSETGAMLGDAPNVVAGRTSKQLGKDFQKGGIGTLNIAINDSGIPALTRAQSAGGGLDSIRQLAMFAGFGIGSNKPINKRLREAMAGDSFVQDLREATHLPARLSLVRMAGSLICTEELDAALQEAPELSRAQLTVVDGYGHEGGDNVVLHALLARQAIEG